MPTHVDQMKVKENAPDQTATVVKQGRRRRMSIPTATEEGEQVGDAHAFGHGAKETGSNASLVRPFLLLRAELPALVSES